ncbi:MAG: RNA polymerase sigma factor [Ignavibacteria bacterium]
MHKILPVPDEKILIDKLIKGDKFAFEELIDIYKDRVYNTSLSLLHNPSDAEDISQEVFTEIFLSVKFFRKESKLSTWIYRITITKSLDHIRRMRRRKRLVYYTTLFGDKGELLYDAPDFVHPGIKAENKELANALFRAISKLPENQKIAFTLNKTESLNYGEIAEVMNISVSAVESLLFRAKKNLKKILEKYYQSIK